MERIKQYEKTITIQEACYYGFFILLSLTKGLGFYEGQKLFYLLVLPALVLGFLKILFTPYTIRQTVAVFLLLFLTAAVFWHSHQIAIFFIVFTVLGMKGMSLKKVLHLAVWVWTVCAVLLSVFSFFRLEHTVYRVHAKMGLGHIFRWSLGFTHPNLLHITYMFLCALAILTMEERYGFKAYLILMFGNLLVFFYSVSYTGFGIVVVLLTGGFYVRLRPRFCFVEKLLANLVLPTCLLLSFVLPFFLYDYFSLIYLFGMPLVGIWTHKLNNLLNTRIWLAEQFLKSGYTSLFGTDVSQIVKSSMNMDCSYIWCYINYGLVFTVVIMLGYFALLFYDTHRQRTRDLVVLVCFLAAGWTEQLLFNSSFKNVTLLFLGELLFLQKEGAPEYGMLFLIPERCREVAVPLAKLPDRALAAARAVCRLHKRKVYVCVVAGALLGLLLCVMLYREPVGYVVQRFYTDAQEETSVYLKSGADPAYEGYRILNYKDAQTPMQIVGGKAVKLETARYCVGSMLIGGMLGAAAFILLLMVRWRKKAAAAVTEISGYDK
ncbi:MAG: hypothetical protein K2N39_02360 [Lachnospiraceae bacterium]|nr:hypothetical protein [Lachnospiraceae bacterium]